MKYDGEADGPPWPSCNLLGLHNCEVSHRHRRSLSCHSLTTDLNTLPPTSPSFFLLILHTPWLQFVLSIPSRILYVYIYFSTLFMLYVCVHSFNLLYNNIKSTVDSKFQTLYGKITFLYVVDIVKFLLHNI